MNDQNSKKPQSTDGRFRQKRTQNRRSSFDAAREAIEFLRNAEELEAGQTGVMANPAKPAAIEVTKSSVVNVDDDGIARNSEDKRKKLAEESGQRSDQRQPRSLEGAKQAVTKEAAGVNIPTEGVGVSDQAAAPGGGKLLTQVKEKMRLLHYSIRTEDAYCGWLIRYYEFHGKRHPSEMGAPEINQFLTHLATDMNVSASTQNQALSALLFLYCKVMGRELPVLNAVRAATPDRLPVVLSVDEVRRVLQALPDTNGGVYRSMGELLYGTGMRLLECCRLRIKDIDFERRQIVVRDGKGEKDRVVPLPTSIVERLKNQIARTTAQHDLDLDAGYGHTRLPYALNRKYPNAEKELGWHALTNGKGVVLKYKTTPFEYSGRATRAFSRDRPVVWEFAAIGSGRWTVISGSITLGGGLGLTPRIGYTRMKEARRFGLVQSEVAEPRPSGSGIHCKIARTPLPNGRGSATQCEAELNQAGVFYCLALKSVAERL